MLGSYFDLKREVARIAAQRVEVQSDARNEAGGAYSDFDERLRNFVRAFDESGPDAPIMTRAAESKHAPSN